MLNRNHINACINTHTLRYGRQGRDDEKMKLIIKAVMKYVFTFAVFYRFEGKEDVTTNERM